MSEDILWFWAVLFFTVPPVLRFRENFLVPGLAMLLMFGFFTQSYWMPDFFNASDWPYIIGICLSILLFYFICGFLVHYYWFKDKSENLKNMGAFSLLLKAWISGNAIAVSEDYITELRRFKLFELRWEDISRIDQSELDIVLSDDVEREPEILSEIRIKRDFHEFPVVEKQLMKREMI